MRADDLEAGQVHAELTHATVDGQHSLEDAVAAGEALIINADEGYGRVNEDALRVLLVQKNYGTRHSFIVRSQQNRRQEAPYLPEATSGCPKRSEGGCPVGAKEEYKRLPTHVPSGARRGGNMRHPASL